MATGETCNKKGLNIYCSGLFQNTSAFAGTELSLYGS